MSHKIVHRQDYQPPSWLIPEVELTFDLSIAETEVHCRLKLERGPGPQQALSLDGEGMDLLEVRLNGRRLGELEYQRDDTRLVIPGVHEDATVETRVRLHPDRNTALEGLYLSGSEEAGFLLTQCEAQGFRHITFFPDRPDVLSRYTVTLRADRARFPVLLAGGNPDGQGALADGRHWARFVDPWPRPSYLFALVAGRLQYIERHHAGADGRRGQVRLWSEAHTIDRCQFAMDALLRAMRWDEINYGRCYDLDVFHVVATQDFNMGAMENKGLNIFNAKYLLIDPSSSTDEDYRRVESVIGHEYFHNWSGNRVTCRNWFELSLKEGFTVFREQSFAADMTSHLVQRIDDVTRLRRIQFAEDSGPLAHSVRPESYSEINNFYTATIYEKGAELVRMLSARLGPRGFRRGTDLYFERHDGQAVTIDDFVAALGDANSIDLTPYLAWYAQAGTPRVTVQSEYDAGSRRLTLEVSQSTPATPGQPHKQPVPIPLATQLFSSEGQPLAAVFDGDTADAAPRILELTELRQRFVFEDVAQQPVVSLLRGFSAPVELISEESNADLAVLLRHESDDFNRWQAGSRLARRAFDEHLASEPDSSSALWCQTVTDVLGHTADADASLLATLMQPADEVELGESVTPLDPEAVHAAREALVTSLAQAIGADTLRDRYQCLAHAEAGHVTPPARARRRLKNQLLRLLCRADRDQGLDLARSQYESAPCMSDRLSSLECLLRHQSEQAQHCLEKYRKHYDQDLLALDKWFMVQATVPGEDTLGRVRALMGDPSFSLRNPNKVHALLSSFSRANPSGFHRNDGGGYQLLAEVLAKVDDLNPQLAARLSTGFDGWSRLEERRRALALQALQELAGRESNSRGLAEMLSRLLAAEAA